MERSDHYYLTADDTCMFFGEYTARMKWDYSDTNQLIKNIKKPMSARGTAQWQYKLQNIATVARAIRANIKDDGFGSLAIVPIPPSKHEGDLEYDDRMVRVARSISPAADVRQLLYTLESRDAAHTQEKRRDPDALRLNIGLRRELLLPAPQHLILLDDVLTTGCSFVVCKKILQEQLPDTSIVGMFAARRVFPPASDLFADWVD